MPSWFIFVEKTKLEVKEFFVNLIASINKSSLFFEKRKTIHKKFKQPLTVYKTYEKYMKCYHPNAKNTYPFDKH